MMGSKIIEIFSHSSGRGMFLRKTVGSKECISYKGLTMNLSSLTTMASAQG